MQYRFQSVCSSYLHSVIQLSISYYSSYLYLLCMVWCIFSCSLADNVCWPIFFRANTISFHEAWGVDCSQWYSTSIFQNLIPADGDDPWISFSLLTGTFKTTPSKYHSSTSRSSSVVDRWLAREYLYNKFVCKSLQIWTALYQATKLVDCSGPSNRACW